jgi:hypothetical protein
VRLQDQTLLFVGDEGELVYREVDGGCVLLQIRRRAGNYSFYIDGHSAPRVQRRCAEIECERGRGANKGCGFSGLRKFSPNVIV